MKEKFSLEKVKNKRTAHKTKQKKHSKGNLPGQFITQTKQMHLAQKAKENIPVKREKKIWISKYASFFPLF